MPIKFPLPPEGDSYTFQSSFSKHRNTDGFRWNYSYKGEYRGLVQIASAQGLKPGTASPISTLAPMTPLSFTDLEYPAGAILSTTIKNETDDTVIQVGGVVSGVNESPLYTSEGLPAGIPVTMSFLMSPGDVITADGAIQYTIAPLEVDTDNQQIQMNQKLEDGIAENKKMILDLKAGIDNKKPSGVTTDITNTTYTVNNSLGGRLTGTGLNIILGSTGIVTVQDANGTREVYNNTGLLSLLAPVPVLVVDVDDGAVITSSGMGELTFETYVAS